MLNRDGSTFDPTELAQSLLKNGDPWACDRSWVGAKETDDWQRRRRRGAR